MFNVGWFLDGFTLRVKTLVLEGVRKDESASEAIIN